MATDSFNPAESAAAVTKTPVTDPKPKSVNHAAVPHNSKKVKMPIPAPTVEVKQTNNGFPAPGDPYWKKHPIETEHQDGSVRKWGEDTTQVKNPNTLPKQMPPPPTPINQNSKKDYFEGYSGPGSGGMRYHQE